ncbi:MAG: GPR endopeptidase [Ruminococcaceae bacterium]|nr:GPR endopeptidase [Oscillospiraceae bacterium]
MDRGFKKYIRTDLAYECVDTQRHPSGVDYSEETVGDTKILRMKIKNEAEAARIGKPQGEYLTFLCEKFSKLDEAEKVAVSSLLAAELIALSEKLTKKPVNSELCVLVAGLGNADMTPDALGPKTVSRITVTGHLWELERKLFETLECSRLYAIAPGVLGETGIESKDLIKGAYDAVKPDLIIAVDALASRDASRLCATVQFSDSGISPGSGVNNRRHEISRATLGAPVIAIGVPTVIDSATLAVDILLRARADIDNSEISEALRLVEPFFVSPRDIDTVTECAAEVISKAIEIAFGIKPARREYD